MVKRTVEKDDGTIGVIVETVIEKAEDKEKGVGKGTVKKNFDTQIEKEVIKGSKNFVEED